MNGKKKTLALLFVLAVCLGVVLVAKGYPDWALNVMQKEGTTFVITGSVDANITNTEINAYVTNTTITIEPAEGTEFIIKPAEAAVFQIQGDVNITNTELNVNVTNTTLNVTGDVNATIQGTASVSIDNATVTIDTATIRENVEAEGKVKTKWGSKTISSGSFEQLFAYANTETYDVYLESVGAVGYMEASPYYPMYLGYGIIVVEVFDESNTEVFDLTYDIAQLPHNFDPAIRIPPNWEIRVYAFNYSPDTRKFEGWILLSYR